MSDNEEDKMKSPFDSELEDETIALTSDELDNILTDAETIQNTVDSSGEPGSEETSIQEGDESEIASFEEDLSEGTESGTDYLEEDEFDISGEIDELSPEDLENIEIEENEIDAYATELESELSVDEEKERGEDISSSEVSVGESLEDEIADIETEGIMLEANIDEEMDLDTYLDSVKSDIDFESTDLKEAGEADEEPPLESPVLGETEDIVDIEAEAEEAFSEAGAAGIADELEAAGIEIDDGGGMTSTIEESVDETAAQEEPAISDEEAPSEETEAGDLRFDVDEDLEISEEPEKEEIVVDEGQYSGEGGGISEEEAFVDEAEITEQETPGEGLELTEGEQVSAGAEPFEEETVAEGAEGIPAGEEESFLDIDDSELQMVEEEAGVSLEEDTALTEEEESILSADFDLDEDVEGPLSEEVVSVTGEELNVMTGEGPASEESGDFGESAGIEEETAAAVGGTASILADTESGAAGDEAIIDSTLYNDISVILKYMDNLLGDLPDEKIKEFSQSKYFSLYKEVFEKLNLT